MIPEPSSFIIEQINLLRYTPSLLGQQSPAKPAQAEFIEHSAGPSKMEVLEVLEIERVSVGINEGLSDGKKEGVSEGTNDGLSDGTKEGMSEGTKEGGAVTVPSKQQSIKVKQGAH